MRIVDIDVAILAGGLGTRLRGVLPGTPKILAPVLGRPFLDHLLDHLVGQGVRRAILCLGYRAADVMAHLRTRPSSVAEIQAVVEPEPLGTAGALSYARPFLRSDPVLVVNGDTIVDLDLSVFLAAHLDSGAEASLTCVKVENAGRYGRLEIDENDRIAHFEEKDPAATGAAWINAGCYLLGTSVMRRIASMGEGSLERDVLGKMPRLTIFGFKARGRFLDIGTPESLALAPEVLKS